jgi:hypothetical protein
MGEYDIIYIVLKRMLIWTFILNSFLFLMMPQYIESYLDVQSDMLNIKFNFSTSYKFRIWFIMCFLFCIGFTPILYFIYVYILNKSTFLLAMAISMCWLLWDLYPISMTNNGYKLQNILMNIFDFVYCGFIWIYISVTIFNNYYKIIEKHNSIVFLLFLLNIFSFWYFFYVMFIYNRKYTENNILVQIGDAFHLDKLLKYTRYFKPNNYKDQYYIMKNTYYGDASQNLSM